MTQVGGGGIRFARFSATAKYKKQYKKLTPELKSIADKKLLDLLKNPFPPGLAFEKLSGYSNPDVYTVHVTGNYKISIECIDDEIEMNGRKIKMQRAHLRRIGTHNEIDRAP